MGRLNLFLLFTCLLLSACRTLGNRVSDLKVLCGADNDSSKAVLQVLDERGQPYSYEQVRTFSFGILDSAKNFRKTGYLTSRACINLDPIKDDELFVVASSNFSQFGIVPGTEIRDFSRVRLEKKELAVEHLPEGDYFIDATLTDLESIVNPETICSARNHVV